MKPRFSREAVISAIARDFDKPSECRPITEGEESQTFAICVGGEDFVLRVNRTAAGFHKDAFCHSRFASRDLPIPEVVAIGEIEDHTWCVSRRAPGVTLQDLSIETLPTVVGPVSQVMSAMADARLDGTEGFGPFDPSGVGRHASWPDFIAAITDEAHYNWKLVEAVVDRRQIDGHFRLLSEFMPRCADVRRLVHGDFGSNNVLTDQGRITAVIDWSEALFGDPIYDVANIFFWRPWLACMEAQAHHIETRQPEFLRNAEALRCYQLHIGLVQIFESAKAGDAEDLAWAMARCEEIATPDEKVRIASPGRQET